MVKTVVLRQDSPFYKKTGSLFIVSLHKTIIKLRVQEGEQGSRGGVVVRALASHQCGLGSILGNGVICGLSLLLALFLL